ncbi:hypothetical protein DEO48_19490 [Enterobacter sp. CGMCC 5087]|nr:hypothetical protein DEO48_19490 [Enterobacter sp. CGMCC 5087]
MNQRHKALNGKRQCCQSGKHEDFFHLVCFLYGVSQCEWLHKIQEMSVEKLQRRPILRIVRIRFLIK